MSITTILFDLDGTLLPMDQDVFVEEYLKLLAKKFAGHGYDPEALPGNIWAGVKAMTTNTGEYNNEEAFWRTFDAIYGEGVRKDIPLFEEYYKNEFQQVQNVCGFNPQAAELIHYVKEKGLRTILATNPLFPIVATASRIRWAGLEKEDFELVTTYENSKHCKPNPDYYRDILNQIGAEPEECLMVGNDVSEDMVAGLLGMKVFLLTDCLINKEDKDIEQYPHGDFNKLRSYINEVIK